MPSNRTSLPNRLNFACAGCLQQGEAVARRLLGIQVALPLIFDLQAGPFTGSTVLRSGLLNSQSGAGCGDSSAGSGRRILGPAYRYGSEYRRVRTAVRMGGALPSCRTGLTSRCAVLRAQPASRHRAQDDEDSQKFWSERFQAGGTQTARLQIRRSPEDTALRQRSPCQ